MEEEVITSEPEPALSSTALELDADEDAPRLESADAAPRSKGPSHPALGPAFGAAFGPGPALGSQTALPPGAPQEREGTASFSSAFPGSKKAAVFVLSLDEEVASTLLRSLSDEELGRITAEIAHLGVVEKETVSSVIREFHDLEELHSMAREGGLEHAVRLVEKSFPQEKAKQIIQALASHRDKFPFSFLEGVETETLMACLEEEHPQTLAVVLAHTSPAKAAEILRRIQPELRRNILERIAQLEGANAEALEQVESSLRKHLDAARFESLGEAGGVKAVAEILRAAGGGGTLFLDDIRQERPELAEEIGKHLFVFDDLVRLDDRAIQGVLKEVDTRRLALALKNASEEIKAKIFGNLSRRAAEILREEMEFLGPVRFAEVEAARRAILETVLRLEASGQLYISGRGREENRIVY
jgi:flagellar motor switch protein FliG